MNNPNMYTKQKKSGTLKYWLLWIGALVVVFILASFAFRDSTPNSYSWNKNEFEYALTEDNENYQDDVAIETFQAKYKLASRDQIYSIEVDLGSMTSLVTVNYMNVEGKRAAGYFEWSSSDNPVYNQFVEEAINDLDQYIGGIDGKRLEVIRKDVANSPSFWTILISALPLIIMVIIGFSIVRSMKNAQGGVGQGFDYGKSKARLEDSSKVRFTDVAGCEDEKEEMKELVDYLKNPKKYAKAGARIPKGVILKGNPGTGKTLLARAVAGEASVPFYYISGSDFLEMFVGVGASRVRDMFKKARATAPCIIFIDEIDAIGRQRGTGFGGGHDEREQTLNQLLVEMDGFDGNSGVIVLAATNRVDVLDPALLRPGRFDRQIEVSLPDLKGRIAILKVHARNKQLAPDVSLESVAKRTPGFSGAQLENVLNEAAIMSVRNRHELISVDDVDEAVDRVMAGPAKKTKIISDRCKKMVAYHEAGHAVVGLKLEDAGQVQKITIIPRGDAGGYVLMPPKDDGYLQTRGELTARITTFLAGRASESIFFEDITTGAASDIEEATNIARAMVTYLGMSSLGPIKYESSSNDVFLGRDYGSGNKISGEIANEIDQEVRKIVNDCFAKAKQIILDNKDLLILIAETLLKYETITADEVNFLVKYGSLDAYDAYKKNSEELAKRKAASVSEQKPIDVKENNEESTKVEENKEEVKNDEKPNE